MIINIDRKLNDTTFIVLTFILPYTMSGTVMELSAIFVDKMIFL